MNVQLVSRADSNHVFEIEGMGSISIATIPSSIQKGERFTFITSEGEKHQALWQGKSGISGYLIGDVERSLVNTQLYMEENKPNPHLINSEHPPILTLILGKNKNVHQITKKDRFLVNGAGIQLIKEHPMKVRYQGDSLFLEENDIRALQQFQRIVHRDNEYIRNHPESSCEVFSIVDDTERFLVMGYETHEDVASKKGLFISGESRFLTAVSIKDQHLSQYYAVKIFDSNTDEVSY
ncbi:TPA: hypothetical protein ACN33X_001586 [Vibrio parahaemolyticus]